jgi:hypothetical protein
MKAQNPAQLLMYSVRARAKRTDTPFDLTANDLIVPEFCPVLGIPLRFSDKGRGDNTPSVDRIEPDKGYVRGNVAVISWRANRMKSKFELAEFEALVTWWNKQKGTAK